MISGTRPRIAARTLAAGGFVCLLVLLAARPARAEPFGWPQPEGPGTPVLLSYSFVNLFAPDFQGIPEPQLRAATAEAFRVWSTYAPLHFIERPDSGPAASDGEYSPVGHPQIRIGAHGQEGELNLGHTFFPLETDVLGLSGDIHLNSDSLLNWGIEDGAPTIDFLEVMLHEIGHALGVVHIVDADAIMSPLHSFRFSRATPPFLLPPDIAAIQAIYGAGEGSVQPIPELPTLTLVSVGALVGFVRRALTSRRVARCDRRLGN